MSRIPMVNADALGMIQDESTNEIDIRAFSYVRNARVQDGAVDRIRGQQPALVQPDPDNDPLYVLPAPLQQDYYWIWGTQDKVFAYNAHINQDISRPAGYSSGYGLWNGCFFNGILVMNNGGDVPQVWQNPGPTSTLVDLPHWEPTVRAKYIGAYKNYLVALNVTKGATVFPQMVKWSHVADPGSIPTSWDETDPTKDAGEFPLSETPGVIMGQMTMRDTNIIYKDDSVYAMTFTGGTSIFRFQRILKESSLLAPYAMQKFNLQGEKHIVLSSDDVFVHDGTTATPILQKRMRKWLFANMDVENYVHAFILINVPLSEAWICFPSNGSVFCDTALIYNYRNQALTIRDLPMVSHGSSGVLNDITGAGGGGTWDSDYDIWQIDKTNWGERAYNPSSDKILLASPAPTSKFYAADVTDYFDGVPFTTTIERDGITIVGTDRQGKPIQDTSVHKLLTYIFPRLETSTGITFNYYVGVQERRKDPITWEGPFVFDPSSDRHVCPLVSGKILSVRLEVTQPGFFRYMGYDIDVTAAGAW